MPFFSFSAVLIVTQDTITAKRNIQKYMTQDPTFSSTRECKFIDAIIEAIGAEDQEAYTAYVVEFDKITKLDPWKTTILLKIKKFIDEEPTIL